MTDLTVCSHCSNKTYIKETRKIESAIYRVRECKKCFEKSSTYEISQGDIELFRAQTKSLQLINNQLIALKEITIK